MNQTQIREFMETYFQAFDSVFLEKHPAYFTVKLPKEVDKDIGNRPFYWSYVEKLGMEPQPLVVTFVFDRERFPNHVRAEEIRFGSARLHQIFASAKKHGRFVRLYEKQALPLQAPLMPWLSVNVKIEFICDRKRDVLLSVGIDLIRGEIVPDFYKKVRNLPLSPKIPELQYTLPPALALADAVERLERYVRSEIAKYDTAWAHEARERLQQEIALLEAYYGEHCDSAAEKEQRIQELRWQYEPRIEVRTTNVGLFFLRPGRKPV
ncbi:YqhG family protein [Bacillaceae bacterium]